jgi:PAS domain S-box-containing protein
MPIPLLLLTMFLLWVGDLRATYDAPHLQLVLNFFTRTLATLVIVVLAGRSFLACGAPGLLLLGCGVAIWGGTGFLATTLATRDANLGVTISNLGAWLSALCYLAGVVLPMRSNHRLRGVGSWLGLGYTLAAISVGLVTLATFSTWLPDFFVQGQGGTMVRHVVLGSAVAMLLLTAVLVWEGNHPSLSPFAYWFLLALLLTATGLCGLMVEASRNTALDWTCRAAQYLSGVYMLIAALAAARESGGLCELVRSQAIARGHYQYAVAIAIVLAATALRLAFQQVLGMRVLFVTFYPAVMLAALYGGLRSGLLATALSVLVVDYFWIGPPGFAVGNAGDWVAFGIFILSCSLISAITEAMHRAQTKAIEARAEARIADQQQQAAEAMRQRTEDALRLSEQEFRSLAEAVPQLVWATRPDGWNIYFNQQWVEYTGMTMEESYGHGWNAPFHPEDKQRAWDAWQRATHHNERYSLECRLRRADGVYRWWLIRGVPMRGPNGEILKWFGTCTDIEELKHHESTLRSANDLLEQRVAERTKALQASEERLRRFYDSRLLGVMFWNLDGKIIDANDKFLEMVGYSREDLRADRIDWVNMTPPEQRHLDEASVAELKTIGINRVPFEKEYIRKDGSRLPILVAGAMLDEARFSGVAFVLDITKRKQADEKLRLSEEKFALAFANNPAAIALSRLEDGLILEVNDTWVALSGFTRDEAIGRSALTMAIWPSAEAAAHFVRELRDKGVLRGWEQEFKKKSGKIYVAELSSQLLTIRGEAVVLSTLVDITTRKRAEELASRSQNMLFELVERSPFGTYIVDSQFRIVLMNKGSQTGAFRNVRPVIGRDFAEAMRILWPEPVAAGIIARFRHTLDAGEPYYSRDFINPRHDAEIVEAYEWELHRMTMSDGQYGVICYYYDSTKLRQAEASVRDSEQQFRVLIQNLQSAVALVNDHGAFTIVNQAFLRMFDLNDESTIKNVNDHDWSQWQVFDEHGTLLDVGDHPIRKAARSGNTVRDQLVAVKAPANPEPRWILVSAEPILDSEGHIHQLICTYHDITERKQAEAALRASLHEKEVLLKEVHHRVKNNMQVISSLISLQSDTIEDEAQRGLFDGLRDQVRTMALVHDKLYQTESLAAVDFSDYARSLLDYLWRAHGVSEETIRLTLDMQPVTLSLRTALPCGLILNELVTNAIKHAFGGRASREITVALHARADGQVCLRVGDNGVGLPAGLDWRQTPSLGLQLVQTLAGQLNGAVEVRNLGGTEFQITFSELDTKTYREDQHV